MNFGQVLSVHLTNLTGWERGVGAKITKDFGYHTILLELIWNNGISLQICRKYARGYTVKNSNTTRQKKPRKRPSSCSFFIYPSLHHSIWNLSHWSLQSEMIWVHVTVMFLCHKGLTWFLATQYSSIHTTLFVQNDQVTPTTSTATVYTSNYAAEKFQHIISHCWQTGPAQNVLTCSLIVHFNCNSFYSWCSLKVLPDF